MTVEPTRFYKAMLLVALAGAAYALFTMPILITPVHPLTLPVIRWELFIFVALIVLSAFTRKITIHETKVVASNCFGSSTFRIDEIKGYIQTSGESTPSWDLLNRENRVLWSFSKPAGIRVFEEEEELIRWIESFDLLNAKGLWPVFQMKMSRPFVIGILFFLSLPFQFIGLEIGLSMVSAK